MQTMNLCIDIDGTITEPYYWLDLTNSFFNKNIREEQINEYEIHKIMGIKRHEYEDFYKENKFVIHANPQLRENAHLVLKILSLAHNIYFVTARDQELAMITHRYLRKNEIPYDELHVLGCPNKVDIAKELKCQIFIEDNYDNALQLAKEGFKVLLIDTNYNRKPLNENVIRVYNWIEIFVKINEISLGLSLDRAQ